MKFYITNKHKTEKFLFFLRVFSAPEKCLLIVAASGVDAVKLSGASTDAVYCMQYGSQGGVCFRGGRISIETILASFHDSRIVATLNKKYDCWEWV